MDAHQRIDYLNTEKIQDSCTNKISISTTLSESVNIDTIQTFVKDQEIISYNTVKESTESKQDYINKEKTEGSMCSPSILDMMLNESEKTEVKKNDTSVNQSLNPIDKGV